MQIGKLLDHQTARKALADKLITERAHPEFPDRLYILNYTEKAAYDRVWNHVTKTCRGLIYDAHTGEVLARPFAKFFNYGQEEGEALDLDAPIVGAWDKLDGSLGILYEQPDGKRAIATRGSFESEQAIHATKVLRADYELDQPWYSRTPLFEIIYPDNRIVLDYHGRDELVYLGNIAIETGVFSPPVRREGYTEVHGYRRSADPIINVNTGLTPVTLREALSLPDREGREGMVVWLTPRHAVKLKQDDYVALHKIVTGLSRKSIWRAMVAGDAAHMIAELPDEFFVWASDVHQQLTDDAFEIVHEAERRFTAYAKTALGTVPQELTREDRKAFANVVKTDREYSKYMFAKLDGRDIWPMALAAIEPKGDSSE